jgi:hypothetical protein
VGVMTVALASWCVSPGGRAGASSDVRLVDACDLQSPIPVAMLSSGVSDSTCSLLGDLVIGVGGESGLVPPAGDTEGADILTTSGSYSLNISNINSVITASESTPSSSDNATGERGQMPARIGDASADTDPACSEDDYDFDENGEGWKTTLNWYYNQSTESRDPQLVGSSPITQIRDGNSNMSNGYNDCGITEQPKVTGAYQGTTSAYANVNASGGCTSNFPDGQNTVSWQAFTNSNVLAATCHIANFDRGLYEADIAIGAQVSYSAQAALPQNCNNGFTDLQSVMTHEWGHGYGLGDLTSGSDIHETMYEVTNPCDLEKRTLARGDVLGMLDIYSYR